MRAVVMISSVANPEERLDLRAHTFDPSQEKEIANDFDLIALEAAVSLKERGVFDEVVLFSAAPRNLHLIKGLAMGADRAVWAVAQYEELTADNVVETLLTSIAPDAETIWFAGKLGVNFESHLTAQKLAARLSLPCLCSVSSLEYGDGTWRVKREEEGGEPTYAMTGAFVLSSDLRLATPRFPSLPNMIKARRKPLEEVALVRASYDSQLRSLALRCAEARRGHCEWIDSDTLSDMLSKAALH